MRAFVTGLDGFAGQWLARELLAAGDSVSGGSRNAVPSYSILESDEAAALRWHRFDLADGSGLTSALRDERPETIYHLAAQASVSESLEQPLATFDLNIVGTARLLEACAGTVPSATVLHVGSADAYGHVEPGELPVTESQVFRPANPYAASKAAAEIVALQFARLTSLRVVATRSFNHTGPGQRTAFAASSFAAQIAAAALGDAPPVLHVGNLDARRDLTDVRDVAHAYRLLAAGGKSGRAYNVCSGRPVSMREIVDRLIGASHVPIEISVDADRLRPSDVPEIAGDFSLLHAATGWVPRIPLEKTLDDLLAWHMRRQTRDAKR